MTFAISSIKDKVTITAHERSPDASSWGTKYSYDSTTDIKMLLNNPPTTYFDIIGDPCPYFQFDLSESYFLTEYSFVHFIAEQPINFTFEGTNDTSNWNCILDDRNKVKYKEQLIDSPLWNQFKIKNPKSFRYYRIKLKENGSTIKSGTSSYFALMAFDAIITKNYTKTHCKCTISKVLRRYSLSNAPELSII